MRISTGMIFDSLVSDIRRNVEDLFNLQERLASGKKVNAPSDDPVGVHRLLRYRETISSMDQYMRNIDFAKNYLSSVDGVLSQAGNILLRLRELAVSQATGTASAETRKYASYEVGELYNQLIGIGNSKLGERYLFSGYLYTTQPFDTDGNYSGDTNETALKIGAGNTFTYGFTGAKVFKGTGLTGGIDIFTKVKDFKTALENNDLTGIQTAIDDMENAISQINNIRAELGARLNRLVSQEEMNGGIKLEMEKLVSSIEDADIAELATALARRETTLQALYTGASRIMGLNIFNFIR